jgi:hypothetical protein
MKFKLHGDVIAIGDNVIKRVGSRHIKAEVVEVGYKALKVKINQPTMGYFYTTWHDLKNVKRVIK